MQTVPAPVLDPVLDPVADPVADPVDLALAAAVARVDAAGWDDETWQWPGLDAGLAELLDRADTSSEPGLRPACERLAVAVPGPDTLAALGVLSEPGVLAGLDEGSRVLLAAGWERAAAWVAACTAPVLVAADDAAAGDVTLDGPDSRWVSDELRAALRWSAVTAGRRVDLARALTASFPATLGALAAGAISATQALILVEELATVAEADPVAAAAAEAALLARAPTQTAAQTRRAARRRAAAAAPGLLAERAAAASRDRGVFLRPEPDGMATLCAVLPAVEAMAAWQVLDTAARRQPITGENDCDSPGRRRIGDARADALLVAILGPAPDPTGGATASAGRDPAG